MTDTMCKKMCTFSLFLLLSEDMVSKLTSLGNPLGRLAETIDFEMFRETLEAEEFENKLCYVYFNKDNTLSLLDKERSTAVDT